MKILVLGGSSGVGKYFVENSDLECVAIARRKIDICESYCVDFVDFEAAESTLRDILDVHKFDGVLNCVGTELVKSSRFYTKQDINSVLLPVINSNLIVSKLSNSNLLFSTEQKCKNILNISSASSNIGSTYMSLYAGTKSFLSGYVKSEAVELAKKNISINNLCCGAVNTEMHARLTKKMSQKSLDNYKSNHLFGFTNLSELNSLLSFLFKNNNGLFTGGDIVSDKGYQAFK